MGHNVKRSTTVFLQSPFIVYTCHASSFFYKRFQEKKKDFSINTSFCWGVMLYIFGDFTWKIQACLSGKIQVKGRQRKYVRGYVYLSVWKCLCAWRCVISYNLECLLAHVVYICVKHIYFYWLSISSMYECEYSYASIV